MMEICACPLCGENTSQLWLRAPDRFDPAFGCGYELQRCQACGMIYLSPRPLEAASGLFYQNENYLPFASAIAPRTVVARVYDSVRRFNLRWKRRLISRNQRTGRLLDVGCGTGEFLAEMRRAGWQVQGLERDANAAAWARQQLGLEVQATGLREWTPPAAAFEVITLWHVLEHLYEPRAALAKLYHLLAAHGVLIVAVPNIASVEAQRYRENWVALDAPRHVNHFSRETLTAAAAAAGLVLRAWQQLPLDAFFNALMSEKLAAEVKGAHAWQWPVRCLRAGTVACHSLFAGSHLPFLKQFRGATIVAVLQRRG